MEFLSASSSSRSSSLRLVSSKRLVLMKMISWDYVRSQGQWTWCDLQRKLTNWRQFFLCVCPLIDEDSRHNIVKIAVYPRGASSIRGQTHKKRTSCLSLSFFDREKWQSEKVKVSVSTDIVHIFLGKRTHREGPLNLWWNYWIGQISIDYHVMGVCSPSQSAP